MAKKVGVLLAGCGYLDGAEIQEAILTLLVLDRAGAEIIAIAPDKPQAHVVDHITGKEMKGETRNTMVEASRIVRGQIHHVNPALADTLDALIMPGGFGVAKQIATYAFDGTDCTVDKNVADLLLRMVAKKKPIGAICISPVVVAKVLEKSGKNVTLTLGIDPSATKDIEAMHARHVSCSATDYVVDRTHKIVSTPAWMLKTRISEIEKGIEKLVGEVLAMANELP